jgi:hypothetical protein
MAPPPSVQRITVGLALVAVLPMAPALLRLRSAAGDERRQAADIALAVTAALLLRPRLLARRIGLLLFAIIMRLLLAIVMMLLLARLELIVARRVGSLLAIAIARLALSLKIIVIAVEAFFTRLAFRAMKWLLLALAELFLRRGDHAEIMLSVLVIILGRHGVPGSLGITRQLDIFLRNMRGRPADFDVRPVRFVNPRERIRALAAIIVIASTHALVLTVSHDLPFSPLRFRTLSP